MSRPERGGSKVFHEPFSASDYYSPERRSERFAESELKEEYRHEKVLATMLEYREKPVYSRTWLTMWRSL